MAVDDARRAEQLLGDGLGRLRLHLEKEACRQLVEYCLELRKWSARINLVAKNTTLPDLVEKHFLDSLLLVQVLDRHPAADPSLLDVGSGAGFPGLVVKIARPAVRCVLLEPRQRRAVFLRHMVRCLHLGGIEVLNARSEEIDPLQPGFSYITGRAVADIPTFLRMIGHIVRQGTLVICMQGAAGRQDVDPGDMVAGFVCCGVEEGVLPFSGAKRFMLLFTPAGDVPQHDGP